MTRSTLRALAALCFLPTLAFGYARLQSPTPRTDQENLKVAECGGAARTSEPNVFRPGANVQVSWFASDPYTSSYFILSFSPAGETAFTVLRTNIPGSQGGSVEVKLPSTPCEECTLQLIQVRTDVKPEQRFYSCADIALRVPTDGGAPPPDAGTSVPDAGTGPEVAPETRADPLIIGQTCAVGGPALFAAAAGLVLARLARRRR